MLEFGSLRNNEVVAVKHLPCGDATIFKEIFQLEKILNRLKKSEFSLLLFLPSK